MEKDYEIALRFLISGNAPPTLAIAEIMESFQKIMFELNYKFQRKEKLTYKILGEIITTPPNPL